MHYSVQGFISPMHCGIFSIYMALPSKKKKERISAIGKKLIKDLEENVYCRLQPSKVHGIGIFAIRDIPKGKNLFKAFTDYELTPVPISMIVNNPKIDKAVA